MIMDRNPFCRTVCHGLVVALLLFSGQRCASAPASFHFSDISRPDFFPIMPWDPQHGWNQPFVNETNGLESIAECHFNMAGFVLPRDLPRCKKLGLGAIVLTSDPAFTS